MGMMISFTPATAIIGSIASFVLYKAIKGRIPSIHTEAPFIAGLLTGIGAGVIVYSIDNYMHQWHSLWWIPVLWFAGSVIGVMVSLVKK
ncbi:MAG: hypothetical protein J7K48_00215 [Thermococcus sp.]|nr:hypothetical protein [Thermococcus sp.]